MAWTSKPVLVVSALFDPATRYEGALQVRSLLSELQPRQGARLRHAALVYSD